MSNSSSRVNAPENDPWLTVKQVAEQLQMNPQTIRIWIEKGKLSAVRPGTRRWLVRQSEVDRMLGAQPPAGDAAPGRVGEPHVSAGMASVRAGERIMLPSSS